MEDRRRKTKIGKPNESPLKEFSPFGTQNHVKGGWGIDPVPKNYGKDYWNWLIGKTGSSGSDQWSVALVRL